MAERGRENWMMQQKLKAKKELDLKLTAREKDVWKTFCTLLKIDKHETFSSDTFRMYGLDRFFSSSHSIGGLFSKQLQNHKIIETGRTRSTIPSNNHREIRIFKLTEA
jgi:hypothetical protein